MPVPTSITDLSTTAASNSPAGADAVLPSLDDYLRALSAFIAQLNAYDARLLAGLGMRNRVINGDFRINQRGYTSGTATTSANQYTLDRWRVVTSGQSVTWATRKNGNLVTAPSGGIEQVIEGENIEGGVYTLSFTGTATARVNGSIVASGGQTSSLTAGANVTLKFTSGTVGEVQFEIGDLKTPFEQRPIGLELALCQRYYLTDVFCGAYQVITSPPTLIYAPVPFKSVMRAVPSVSIGTATNACYGPTGSAMTPTTWEASGMNQYGFRLDAGHSGGVRGIISRSFTADAEL